jgi:hypothetical protein
VPADQGFESRLIMPADEGLQEVGVADVPAGGQERGAAKLSHHPVACAHRQWLLGLFIPHNYIAPKITKSFLIFKIFSTKETSRRVYPGGVPAASILRSSFTFSGFLLGEFPQDRWNSRFGLPPHAVEGFLDNGIVDRHQFAFVERRSRKGLPGFVFHGSGPLFFNCERSFSF